MKSAFAKTLMAVLAGGVILKVLENRIPKV